MGYANIQADSNFYRQSLNADGIKDVTGPYTSLYEDVFRAITVTTDSVVSVTSYVGDSLSNQFLLAGTEIYGLFSSVTIHSGNAILHLAGASYISEIVNQYSASGIPLGFYEEGTQCLSQKISALLTQGVFDDASWVMVPSQYEEDWVRAFKPTSTLGDLAFTRASDATRTNSAGVVELTPWNLFTFSEQLENVLWLKNNIAIVSNAGVAPDGMNTADSYASTITVGPHPCYQSKVVLLNTYTYSVYVKKINSRYVSLKGAGGRFIWTGVIFDLDTASVVSIQNNNIPGTTGSITPEANGWYRISITATSNFNDFGLQYASSPSNTFTDFGDLIIAGSGVVDYLLWGMQVVQGSSRMNYFPTTDRLNVPRLDYSNADGTLSTCPRLLLEPQRTNSIRNSSMVGAVAGSPGTLPTNWGVSAAAGLTTSVVGVGTENGLPYVDIRINGTATGTAYQLRHEATTTIVASVGQIWTGAAYIKKISEPAPPLSYRTYISEHNAAGSELGGGSFTINPTTSLQRFAQTRTLSNASTERVLFSFISPLTSGATYDFTIRIAAPQMELGNFASTWVPTTTAAVTRIAEIAAKTGVSSIIGQTEGTIFWDINDLTGTTSTGNPDYGVRNTAFTNWIGITTNTFASPFRVVVRPTSGIAIDYTANITRAKAAVAWSSAGAVLFVNGVQVGTSAVNPNFSFDLIDMRGNNISYKTNQAALFPTRLENATLAALTTL